MINGVKGSRKIKKTKTSNLLLINGPNNMIMNCKECSFSGMIISIGRLRGIKQELLEIKFVRRFLATRSVSLERKNKSEIGL
jgi:hypothetical protein